MCGHFVSLCSELRSAGCFIAVGEQRTLGRFMPHNSVYAAQLTPDRRWLAAPGCRSRRRSRGTCGWRLSRNKQVVDVSDRDDVPGCGREVPIHRNQGISLQLGDREVLGVPERVPVVLACELLGGSARHPVRRPRDGQGRRVDGVAGHGPTLASDGVPGPATR